MLLAEVVEIIIIEFGCVLYIWSFIYWILFYAMVKLYSRQIKVVAHPQYKEL